MPVPTADAPLWLSEADVEALIDPKGLLTALREGFAGLASGRIREPASLTMPSLDGGGSYLSLLPAFDAVHGLASAKLLAGRPENARDGVPEIDAVVALAEAHSARITALIAARALTAWRTAAVTALALAALAPPGRVVGLAGTGEQARTHARMLAATGMAQAIVCAAPRRGLARAEAFAADLSPHVPVPVRASPLGTLAGACDVLVTLSLAEAPLALGPLPDSLVLACVGPFLPRAHEIEPRLAASASLVVSDHPERLRRQWADHPAAFAPTMLVGLTELLAGAAEAPAAGLRLFFSDGRGFEDNIAGRLVYEAALRQGRGLRLP